MNGVFKLAVEQGIDGERAHMSSVQYLARLHIEYVRSQCPEKILDIRDYNKIVSVGCRNDLNIRYKQQMDDDGKLKARTFNWRFDVLTTCQTRYLKRVVLKDSVNRDKFSIKNIFSNHPMRGLTSPYYVQTIDLCPPSNERRTYKYMVEIRMETAEPGSYCQDVIFDFAGSPAIIRTVCAELLTIDDLSILKSAEKYLSLLNEKRDEKPYTVQKLDQSVSSGDLEERYEKPYPETVSLMIATLKERDFDVATYTRRMHELLHLEEIAMDYNLACYNTVASSLLLKKREGKIALPGELLAAIPLSSALSEDTRSGRVLLQCCDRVIVTGVKFNKRGKPILNDYRFEAVIEQKFNNLILLRLSVEVVKTLGLEPEMHTHLSVQFILNRKAFCQWHKAIDCLADARLVFPSPQLCMDTESTVRKSATWCEGWTETLGHDQILDYDQKKAIAMINAPENLRLPPILVMGPYGTGKTPTIAKALKILLLSRTDSKVLLCTQSNSAADLYIKDFFDKWYTETGNRKLKPLRIYYTGRAVHTVSPTVHKYCLIKEPTDPEAPIGPFLDPSPDDVEAHSLIICTLATSSCLMPLGLEPSHIIIDEAAQAYECEILSCLSMVMNNTRIVLAGDKLQLAPEVHSDLARDRGLGISMLERLDFTYENKHPCRIQLKKNYRTHQDIVELTSILYYLHLVEPGIEMPVVPSFRPITFFACQGNAVQELGNPSYYNLSEVKMIADEICKLRDNWPAEWGAFDAESIGVLSHYGQQITQIRQELRSRSLSDVTVERVLNVQGKEYNVVFISIVRTLEECDSSQPDTKVHDYGFLSNKNLLNTAITRARCSIAVVGDPRALLAVGACRSLWKKFLEYADLRNTTYDKLIMDMHHQSATRSKSLPLDPQAKEFVPRLMLLNSDDDDSDSDSSDTRKKISSSGMSIFDILRLGTKIELL